MTLLYPYCINSKTSGCVQTSDEVLPSYLPYRLYWRVSSKVVNFVVQNLAVKGLHGTSSFDHHVKSLTSRLGKSFVLPFSVCRYHLSTLSYQAEKILNWKTDPKKSAQRGNAPFHSCSKQGCEQNVRPCGSALFRIPQNSAQNISL